MSLHGARSIRERLVLEQKIEAMESAQEAFTKLLEEFELLANQWKANRAALAKLPKDDTTDDDRKRLSAWSESIRSQLKEYGFKSDTIPPIAVSPDTYKPEHDGFDLQTSISASDTIRTIWAYLLGLVEISTRFDTHHPKFLIFDEPKQQSTKDFSFIQLLHHASSIESAQIIFFTSEDNQRLKDALVEIKHSFVEFKGRVLTSRES